MTEALRRRLEQVAPLATEFVELDDADAHIALARHVGGEIERVLDALPKKERTEHARAFAAKLIGHLASLVDDDSAALVRDQMPEAPARRLTALYRGSPPGRPKTPLTTSSLLTGVVPIPVES